MELANSVRHRLWATHRSTMRLQAQADTRTKNPRTVCSPDTENRPLCAGHLQRPRGPTHAARRGGRQGGQAMLACRALLRQPLAASFPVGPPLWLLALDATSSGLTCLLAAQPAPLGLPLPACPRCHHHSHDLSAFDLQNKK